MMAAVLVVLVFLDTFLTGVLLVALRNERRAVAQLAQDLESCASVLRELQA